MLNGTDLLTKVHIYHQQHTQPQHLQAFAVSLSLPLRASKIVPPSLSLILSSVVSYFLSSFVNPERIIFIASQDMLM
jgi:hypothetical protein